MITRCTYGIHLYDVNVHYIIRLSLDFLGFLLKLMETVKAIHPHFRRYLILLPLLKVLFEELRLDQKCKKKLARTSIKNYKSTSEAVVNMQHTECSIKLPLSSIFASCFN